MIEPTESECKDELDRFCDALLNIRDKIARIERGEWNKYNPINIIVKNAPHTQEVCLNSGISLIAEKQLLIQL